MTPTDQTLIVVHSPLQYLNRRARRAVKALERSPRARRAAFNNRTLLPMHVDVRVSV